MLGSVELNPAAAEQRRGHTVERGRLMEAYEPVGIEPMATRTVAAVDDRDRDLRRGGERVHERHSHRARPDHEVIDIE